MDSKSSNYAEHKMKFFQLAREKKKFCDIFFSVNNRFFDLHRVILFSEMGLYLESHARTASMMVGSGSNPDDRIIIDNFPGGDAAFSQIIDHCYSYEPIINASNAVQLFYAADYFCMSEFQSRIQDFIEDFFLL
mmetsp:Transcript_4008/g.5578  ORF Transcript_4008/g.5578 Transcript_4008/m.5578 type:complete len:134 (+) Transcript_4008:13-414(+)